MNSIDKLNYRKDSSTKIKLKLDNSKVKLTLGEESFNTAEQETEERVGDQRIPLQSQRREAEPEARIERPLEFQEEDYYLDNMANYNTRVLEFKQSHSFTPYFGIGELCSLETVMDRNADLRVPVHIKTDHFGIFKVSNKQIEPRRDTVEGFIKMNLTAQKSGYGLSKGNQIMAHRRRRRGTLKSLKES